MTTLEGMFEQLKERERLISRKGGVVLARVAFSIGCDSDTGGLLLGAVTAGMPGDMAKRVLLAFSEILRGGTSENCRIWQEKVPVPK